MKINEMQSKLARWSKQEQNKRFNRLLRLIVNPEWLSHAADITLASSGAKTSGVDGINKDKFIANRLYYLQQIRKEVLDGTYQPSAARRIYIPKANGKQRPLGIPTIRDRILQRAILMALEPIWESDFHRLSYGFRPGRSVHHAVRTVKFQLQDGSHASGRWVIEGDLASYFDTVHHKLLMKCIRKRVCDNRLLNLIWRLLKAGHIDRGMFCAASTGVPQGGVMSPLFANIMLHEFDNWLEAKYLGQKVRRDRWTWNSGIQKQRPIAKAENRQWKPAVAYSRFADDFVLVVKGNKTHASTIREECNEFLRDKLKLTLNLDKTKITHVDDGFTFLGHRIVRKIGPHGNMRPVTNIPKEKYSKFAHSITSLLSGNYNINKIDMIKQLNYKIIGWSNFYQFTDYTAKVYSKLDRIIFWKFAHWLGVKYKSSIKSLMKHSIHKVGNAKIWRLSGIDSQGRYYTEMSLSRLASSKKLRFKWRNPINPYLPEEEENSYHATYKQVAMAMS
ncbi:MAG: group II intron reverse transcriptase/maturase [Microcystis sp. M122S2]|uniref:group II intron reverse transcriptase/maturase n=1 Tax=Microcystis sp. M122S2 TaxID=2771142 RepID=UPI00258C843E|nr:group II intron reverse transcriptase/maturase [Microcystis sp. M122S2]MCA2772385.1 group II intron reverse transcriptase/maturase [Microcystis sp. M122S2]